MKFLGVLARENQRHLILVFYLFCLAAFIVAFIYRQNVPIAYRTAGSIGAMVSTSGLMLWLMALLIHWKTFWVFFVAHSLIMLFLLIGVYGLYAYSISSPNSFLSASFVDFRRYFDLSVPSAAMCMIRFVISKHMTP